MTLLGSKSLMLFSLIFIISSCAVSKKKIIEYQKRSIDSLQIEIKERESKYAISQSELINIQNKFIAEQNMLFEIKSENVKLKQDLSECKNQNKVLNAERAQLKYQLDSCSIKTFFITGKFTFVGFGDYFHLVFTDSDNKKWDFGESNNHSHINVFGYNGPNDEPYFEEAIKDKKVRLTIAYLYGDEFTQDENSTELYEGTTVTKLMPTFIDLKILE